jgi:hypothetical protein
MDVPSSPSTPGVMMEDSSVPPRRRASAIDASSNEAASVTAGYGREVSTNFGSGGRGPPNFEEVLDVGRPAAPPFDGARHGAEPSRMLGQRIRVRDGPT